MGEMNFLETIKSGKILVADGATGTNLQRRGLKPGASPESWLLEWPEQIEKLHRDFIEAGADLILTCTFGANAMRLKAHNLDSRLEEINQLAVSTARKAASGTSTFVAGSIGPLGVLFKPFGPVDTDEAQEIFAQQAKALDAAGVDLLVVETQFDIDEASAAIMGVRSVSKLPLVCSFSFDRGTRTTMGIGPSRVARELPDLGVDILGINCGHGLESNYKALQELRSLTKLPIWFKPNAGLPHVDEGGNMAYDTTPEMMAEHVPQWLELGVSVVGGCCGTSPEHLKALATRVKAS
jgi:5-methyltetrahydrofolate--homocysteine methyltransferase